MWDFQKQHLYLTFALNPEVDWTEATVQDTWCKYGFSVDKFLCVETATYIGRRTGLCPAYVVQHASAKGKKMRTYSLEHQLLELSDKGIVIVGGGSRFISARAAKLTLSKRRNKDYDSATE